MLDKNSIQALLDTGVHSVFISFIQSGCAGTKVSVQTEFDRAGLVGSYITPELLAFYRKEEQEILEHGYITSAKGKWIFSSKEIQDRCGCGESFSFEKKLIDTDKLAKLQSVFGKKRGFHE